MSVLNVRKRLAGNNTTDFGAPDVALASDAQPMDDAELLRFSIPPDLGAKGWIALWLDLETVNWVEVKWRRPNRQGYIHQ